MGYFYTHAGDLCCDSCGSSTDVKKRTCPHRVNYHDGTSLPLCPPPALCPACWQKHGKNNKIHAACKEHARKAQEREDQRHAAELAGAMFVSTCWGDWKETVPAGFVGVRFYNSITRQEAYRLIPAENYRNRGPQNTLDDFPDAQDWTNPDTAGTKRIA